MSAWKSYRRRSEFQPNLRMAIHEIGHGLIALKEGYTLKAVRLDGERDNPGQVDREIPGGLDGNHPDWAPKELALFCAGYIAEKVVYTEPHWKYVEGHPEADKPMIDQCALVILAHADDIEKVNKKKEGTNIRRDKLRTIKDIDWGKYDALIHDIENEVEDYLTPRKKILEEVGKTLLYKRVLSGAEFQAELAKAKV